MAGMKVTKSRNDSMGVNSNSYAAIGEIIIYAC